MNFPPKVCLFLGGPGEVRDIFSAPASIKHSILTSRLKNLEKMAAKLKKRALAEYQSQVEDQDESQQKQKTNKKLKLLMPRTSTR